MISGLQTYTITSLAGSSLAGRRRPPGPTITLTPEEAEYELRAGTIVPLGQASPLPTPNPAVQSSDKLTTYRNGSEREPAIADLEAFLLTPGRPIAIALAALIAGGQPPDATAPTIITTASQTVVGNAAFSLTLEANEAVTWSKTGGADAALFTLSGATITMAAKAFASPADVNGNNAYEVEVTATDVAGNSRPLMITVAVTDPAETSGGNAPGQISADLSDPNSLLPR